MNKEKRLARAKKKARKCRLERAEAKIKKSKKYIKVREVLKK